MYNKVKNFLQFVNGDCKFFVYNELEKGDSS